MKKYFFINIFIILIVFIFCIGMNFFIDSYGVFFRNLEYQSLEPNQNYMKTSYIIKNPQKFQTYLFGSSRVGAIPVEIIKDERIYNMSYSEGIPEEWFNNIKLFVENNVDIKKVLIGIDDISFKVEGKNHLKEQMRMPYELINKKKIKFENYILYSPFTKYNKEKIKNILKRKEMKNKENFYENGRFFKFSQEEMDLEIEKNKEIHLSKEVFKKDGIYKKIKFLNKNEVFEKFEKIEKICNKNQIEIIFFFNPIHKNAFSNEEKKEYEDIKNEFKIKFKKNIIFDFSDTELSYNNYYWYETSHYRIIVGERILKEIYKK